MKQESKIGLLALILMLALFAAACPERTSISTIESNPSKYYGKSVGVAGTVETAYGISIPLLGQRGGIYKVDDGTGSIWVVTQKSVPSKGAKVGVKGRIENGINYNGKNYGLGMVEEDRRIK